MSTTEMTTPERQSARPPLERLFLMWLRAGDLNPRAFLARLQMPVEPLRRATGGWLKKRKLAQRGDFRPFEGPLARLKVSVLWWELVARVGEELEQPEMSEAELKRLGNVAAILKAAQAGLNQAGAFESPGAEIALPTFEGLDVERL